MKIKTIENMAVIELDVTASNLEKVMKYSPEALTIKNDDGDELFKVIVSDTPAVKGAVTVFGAVFSISNDKPLLWIGIPNDSVGSREDKEAYLLNKMGMEMTYIRTIETQIKDALRSVDSKINAVKDCIESLD